MEKLPNPSHKSLFRSNFWNERNILPIFSQPCFRHISICMIEAISLISGGPTHILFLRQNLIHDKTPNPHVK